MSGPAQFRKKPLTVEAMQVLDDMNAVRKVMHWVASNGGLVSEPFLPSADHVLAIVTREGEMQAGLGDWIVREPNPTSDRKFYPVKPDIFAATYDAVADLDARRQENARDAEGIA